MSQLLHDANPMRIIQLKDERLHNVFQSAKDTRRKVRKRHDVGYEGFYSEFWPGNRGFVGDLGLDVAVLQGVWGRRLKRFGHGEASRVGFVGVTRNQYGAPLGGVTCVLHKTSDRSFVHEIVSDANGNFLLQSWYSPDTHYIVFHKAGSPNVYGSTDNNLVGA